MIELVPVNSKEQKQIVKRIIEKYHSYVPSNKSVGRRIDWLIYHNTKLVGMIGIGSSVYPPPKDILKYVGMSKNEYKSVFNTFANNWRFCMMESIQNAGTRILKELRNQAPKLWKDKYGDDLNYILTFVAGGNNGAVYRADNWTMVGETSGLPKHKSVSMKWDDSKSLSEKFVKPTGENKKLIFMKDIR